MMHQHKKRAPPDRLIATCIQTLIQIWKKKNKRALPEYLIETNSDFNLGYSAQIFCETVFPMDLF